MRFNSVGLLASIERIPLAALTLSNVLREAELYGVSGPPGGFAWTCGINRQIAGPDQPLVEHEVNKAAPPPP
jgi:hypothetical protein